MQRHTMTEIVIYSRSTVMKRSVNTELGGGVGALIEWPLSSPLVVPWYTQDICSVRVKGF